MGPKYTNDVPDEERPHWRCGWAETPMTWTIFDLN